MKRLTLICVLAALGPATPSWSRETMPTTRDAALTKWVQAFDVCTRSGRLYQDPMPRGKVALDDVPVDVRHATTFGSVIRGVTHVTYDARAKVMSARLESVEEITKVVRAANAPPFTVGAAHIESLETKSHLRLGDAASRVVAVMGAPAVVRAKPPCPVAEAYEYDNRGGCDDYMIFFLDKRGRVAGIERTNSGPC